MKNGLAGGAYARWRSMYELAIWKMRCIAYSDIERKCGIDTNIWENQYILSNRIIHASPQAALARLSSMGSGNIMPVGRRNLAHYSCWKFSNISSQITSNFLTIYESNDVLVSVNCINIL